MSTYRVYTYDVWGNERDGFDVNDVFRTNDFVEISADATNDQIVKALKKEGLVKPRIQTKSVGIEGGEDAIYVTDARNGKPEYELRLEPREDEDEDKPLTPFFVRDADVPAWWTDQHDRVLSALKKAADRIATAAHKGGQYEVKRGRKGQVVRGYTLTQAHQEVMDAIDDLARNRISPEDAMAVLHGYDVLKART